MSFFFFYLIFLLNRTHFSTILISTYTVLVNLCYFFFFFVFNCEFIHLLFIYWVCLARLPFQFVLSLDTVYYFACKNYKLKIPFLILSLFLALSFPFFAFNIVWLKWCRNIMENDVYRWGTVKEKCSQ